MRRTLGIFYRRCFAALAVAAFAVSCICGCADTRGTGTILYNDSSETAQSQKNLTMFGYKADTLNLVAIEDILHGFMDENPDINIDYEGLKGSDYWNALDKRVAADVCDDLFMLDHDHILELGANGRLADLSSVSGIENYEELTKTQFVNGDGSVWSLPICTVVQGLYINYDLLEANGQEIPENLEEFTEICDYYVSQGVTPIIANNYNSLRSLIIAKGLYPIYQGDVSAEFARFDSDEGDLAETLRPGVELVVEMFERGWMDGDEVLVTEQTSDDLALFAEGTRPFMISGGWASPRVAAMDVDFSYGVHPFPILEDGSVLVMEEATYVSVNADSPYVEEAKEFLSYLIQPDVLWSYCESQSSYTPLKDDRTPSDEAIVPCLDYLTNGRSVFGGDYRLSVPLDSCLWACTESLCSGMGADDVVEQLRGLIDEASD